MYSGQLSCFVMVCCFCQSDGLFVQIPGANRLTATFPRQIGIQLPLGLIESLFSGHSRAMRGVIGFFDLSGKQHDFRIDLACLRFALGPGGMSAFRRQLFVSGGYLAIPARFHVVIQLIQSGIGLIGGLSYSPFFKEPSKNRPTHRLIHQFFRFFDLAKFSHRAMNIAVHNGKVYSGPGHGNLVSFDHHGQFL